jgi:hypothetical protein
MGDLVMGDLVTGDAPTATAVPQGWYTDPLEPTDVRWWTGEDWTHHVQPRPVAVAVSVA